MSSLSPAKQAAVASEASMHKAIPGFAGMSSDAQSVALGKWIDRVRRADKKNPRKPSPDEIGGGYFHPAAVAHVFETEGQKRANIGGDPQGSFEQSFATLGYNYLSDKAPRLLEHLLGFQLLDRNDDMTRAVGVYGFQAGSKRLFMPLFFLNGELRGQELLFVQNNSEGQFVPMKENWVNFLLSKSPHVMGEASQKDVFQMGGMWPDLRPFTGAYRGGKYSCDMPRIEPWCEPFMPVYAKMVTTNPLRDPRYAKLASAKQLLFESPFAVKHAVELCERFPNIKAAMHQHYGADVFEQALLSIKARLVKDATVRNSILHVQPIRAEFVEKTSSSILPDMSPVDPIKSGSLKIMRVDPEERFTHNIPERSREEATGDTRRGSIVITDKRAPEQKSTLYNVALPTAYTNPTQSQVVDVLTDQGKFEKCLIVHNPYSGGGQHSFVTVVRLEGGRKKNWLNSDATNIWTRPPANDRQHFKEWFDGLSSAKPSKGSTYVALTGDGCGTLPFEVTSVLSDGDYRVDYETCSDRSKLPHLSRNYNSGLGYREMTGGPAGYSSYDAIMHLNGRKGSSFRSVGGELYLPESAKLIKVQDPPDFEAKDEDDVSPLKPGNLIDVQNQIIQKTAYVKLWAPNSDEIVLTSRLGHVRLSKLAAYVSLVRDHGLGIPDADAAIEKATKLGAAKFRILYAPAYEKHADPAWPGYGGDLLDQGPSAPREGPPPTGSGYPWSGGAINRYPQEEHLEVPGMNAYQTDPWIYDPTRIPDSGTGPSGNDQSTTGVQNAAATGQKDVFDTSVLSNLLNAVRQDSIVDRYLSDLMTGLDRIGRILFAFYWHMDDVKERYGAADTPELIDAMRNAFESNGDVTLKLRQHSMNPDVGEMGEPNIEEVSRAD